MGETYNARYKLTWMSGGRRWRKKYRGKMFYFPIREGETKTASYNRCLREWNATLDKLKAADVSAALSEEEKSRLAESVRLVAHGFEYGENGDTVEKIVVDMPPVGLPANGDAIADYIGKLLEGTAGTIIDRKTTRVITVGEEIDSQVNRKKAEADAGHLAFVTATRYGGKLEHFRTWVGGNTPIMDVSARTLLDYHSLLLEEVKGRKRTAGGAKTQFQAVRHLLNTACLLGAIDHLPKILTVPNKLLSFGTVEDTADLKRERNWADDLGAFKKILDASSGRLRLYLLLMMNCGYQQMDVSEFGQREVDWKQGRIRRKRSKGRKQKNVPEVDYLLWRETFDLLTQYKAPEAAERNAKGDPRAIVNANGTSLINPRTDTDAIDLAYKRLLTRLTITGKTRKPLAAIRKTSSTLIRRSKYADLRFYFLGHAPATIADRNYTVPSQEQFDECIRWLGQQYGIE